MFLLNVCVFSFALFCPLAASVTYLCTIPSMFWSPIVVTYFHLPKFQLKLSCFLYDPFFLCFHFLQYIIVFDLSFSLSSLFLSLSVVILSLHYLLSTFYFLLSASVHLLFLSLFLDSFVNQISFFFYAFYLPSLAPLSLSLSLSLYYCLCVCVRYCYMHCTGKPCCCYC